MINSHIIKQVGFSLVELMIAMLLGLFLTGAVIEVFLSSKVSYSTVSGQSSSLDNGRFGMFFISGSLKHAGFFGVNGIPRRFEVHDNFPVENAIVFGLDNDASDAAIVDGSDSLYVRMTGADDSKILNCLGQGISSSQVAVDQYYLGPAKDSETASSLYCSSQVFDFNSATQSITGTPTKTTRALINGIEDMQVLYGVGENDSISQYLTATEVSALDYTSDGFDWSSVGSVKVALLSIASEDSSGVENSETYTLLDKTYTAPADQRLRTVFQSTIALRNYIPKS